MNRARAFVNDAFRGGKGRILTDQAPFTIEYLNSALEELQDLIGNNGVITLIQDNIILTPVTPIVAVDPSVQVFISYEGYFDGTVMHATPVLPSNMRAILKAWERQTGSGLPFQPMGQPREGLPSQYQAQFFGQWEWRADRMYMIGSTVTEDIRLRIETRSPVLSADADFSQTQIVILSSVNALATYVAYVYARARGAQAAAVMQADADRQARYILRRYSRQAQAIPYRRKPYGAGAGNTGNGVWGTNLPF